MSVGLNLILEVKHVLKYFAELGPKALGFSGLVYTRITTAAQLY